MRNGIRELIELAGKLHDYIRIKGPWFFDGWTREALEDYLLFHMKQGTIVCCLSPNGNVIGLFVGWQQRGTRHRKWRWQKHDNKGNCFWLDQFMADDPMTAASLVVEFVRRWPKAAKLPCVAFRNKRIRYYKPGSLWKIFKKAEGLYGDAH